MIRVTFGDPEAKARKRKEKERRKKDMLTAKLAKKRMEFSKKILFVSSIIFVAVLGYAAWIQYLVITKDFMGDTSITLAMMAAVGAEVTSGVTFYYWKAKAENLERERRKTSVYELAAQEKGVEEYGDESI